MNLDVISRYRKTISAVITGLIGWATAVTTSDPDPISSAEWIFLATIIATALGVYGVPNDAPAGDHDPNISERGVGVVEVLLVICLILFAIWLVRVLAI